MNPNQITWRFWRIDVAGLSACAAMVLLLIFAGLRPLLQQRAVCQTQSEQLAAEQDELDAAQAAASAMGRRLDDLERSLAGCTIRLEPLGELNRRLGELAALAGEMELTVDETASGDPAVTEHYFVVPVRLSGTGSYERCTRFLHQLRARFPDTRLSLIELTGRPDGSGLFRLEVRWYAAPAKEQMPL